MLVTKLRNDNDKDDDDDDTGKEQYDDDIVHYNNEYDMIVTNEMYRKRSKFDARMSMQQEQDE